MSLQQSYLELAQDVFPPLANPIFPITIDHASGSYLYDLNNKKYIDFAGGIAISPIGHCHPAVVKAMTNQIGKLTASMNILNPKVKIDCAKKIIDIMPNSIDKIFFANSGTEAVEGALKLAYKYNPDRKHFISFNKSFHGRSFGALSVTGSKASYKKDLPTLHNIHFVDYPEDCLSLENTLEQIDKLFKYTISPENIAGIIVEPILGEGGYIIPPDDFLPQLRHLCDEHGILLIIDEIQTGFGRTGQWFACQHNNINPDILCFAKGVASGMPLGGFGASKEIMDTLIAGTHGSTFGGNPVCCAAAIATINTIESEWLIERVNQLGSKIIQRLHNKFSDYLNIRGRGFMIAIEAHENIDLDISNILKRLATKGLMMLSCGYNNQVLRLMPALNISETTLNEGLSILEQVLDYELLIHNECKRLTSDSV